MTCVHSQTLGRANDRTLAAPSAAMVMGRLERIVSSVDKNRPTCGRQRRLNVSQKTKLLSILECNTCFGNHAITVPIRCFKTRNFDAVLQHSAVQRTLISCSRGNADELGRRRFRPRHFGLDRTQRRHALASHCCCSRGTPGGRQ